MRKDDSEQRLRDAVETMVAEIGDQAQLEADRYRQYPEEFEWDFEARWNRILGVNKAASRLGLKSPLSYRSKVYTRKAVCEWAWFIVVRNANRRREGVTI